MSNPTGDALRAVNWPYISCSHWGMFPLSGWGPGIPAILKAWDVQTLTDGFA